MLNYVENNSKSTLIGNDAIARYLGICVGTLNRWRRLHGFPAGSMPDGRVITTENLIDQWIMQRIGSKGRRNQSPGRHGKRAQCGTESQQTDGPACA